ncbi:hypothetical protein HELRODRAFT_123898, partial [Helobdella robusta]|uniref:UDP-glucuronosyltransferase n=1 Tax=Helobdella robusta TaxID=6412 RepID=T1EGZ6_HELRO
KASLWFFLEDLSVSQPNVLMPNTLSVGDIIVDDDQLLEDLPKNLLEFVSSPKYYMGCVLVSFGSVLKSLPKTTVDAFCRAFKRFKNTMCFVWKYPGKLDDVCPHSENIYLMSWVPQKNLLAHVNVKLFISHGGLSSLIESVYFEKPMIIFPLIFDQFGNSATAEERGYAISMVISNFRVENLIDNIRNMTADASPYLKSIQFYSKILKYKTEKPNVRVSRLINHVIEYGDAHLRTSAYDLNFIQYFMIDIIVFTLLVLISTTLFLL